jgi:hypothetical protein
LSWWFGIGIAGRGDDAIAILDEAAAAATAAAEEDAPGGGEDGDELGWTAEAGPGWYLFGCCDCDCWDTAAAAAMDGDVCCRSAVKKFVRKKERWEGMAGVVVPGIVVEER